MLPLLLASLTCAARAQSKATLDVSETLFSVVAAMNVCGYDQELQSSSPIRMEVRADLVEASKSPDAAAAAKEMCHFYRDHQQSDGAHDLAQYVSLALYLGPPPDFTPKVQRSRYAAGFDLRAGIRAVAEAVLRGRQTALDLAEAPTPISRPDRPSTTSRSRT